MGSLVKYHEKKTLSQLTRYEIVSPSFIDIYGV